MAYSIMIKKGVELVKLDISNLPTFERLSKYKDSKTYSLEEIDLCTSKYENIMYLKKDLVDYFILPFEDISKDISIGMKNGDNYKKVKKGIVFKNDIKYLDYLSLKYILLSKQKDKLFLERLAAYYRGSYINNINVLKIANMISNDNYYGLTEVLQDFYNREVTRFDKREEKYKLSYKAFRDLGMFISKYDEASVKRAIDKDYKSVFKNNDSKKRVKKKIDKEIEGQMSFL